MKRGSLEEAVCSSPRIDILLLLLHSLRAHVRLKKRHHGLSCNVFANVDFSEESCFWDDALEICRHQLIRGITPNQSRLKAIRQQGEAASLTESACPRHYGRLPVPWPRCQDHTNSIYTKSLVNDASIYSIPGEGEKRERSPAASLAMRLALIRRKTNWANYYIMFADFA